MDARNVGPGTRINVDHSHQNDESTPAKALPTQQHKELHIAPMMGVTNREFRQLMRILSKRAILWTEMIADNTIVYTKHLDRPLEYERHNSHPIVVQLGGNNADHLRKATEIVLRDYDYDEVNLNCGCPSSRVAGRNEFGAILMKQKDVAEAAIQAMMEGAQHAAKDGRLQRPISVKCRIGVDDNDSLDDLVDFIQRMCKHCNIFHLHARKAIIGGLNPVENRNVPPLNYPRVYEICRLFPDCQFIINGGIKSLHAAKDLCYGAKEEGVDAARHHVCAGVPCSICNFDNGSCIAPPPFPAPSNLIGCMVGRIAMENPCSLGDIDRFFYGEPTNPCRNRREVVDKYCTYLESIYPRRCCDLNTFQTCHITEQEEIVSEFDCCPRCWDIYYPDGQGDATIQVAPTDYQTHESKPKIKTHIMSRAAKPIQNIFFGLPYAQKFSRECENLVRDLGFRNCGPGALIRKAIRVMPDEILERPLPTGND